MSTMSTSGKTTRQTDFILDLGKIMFRTRIPSLIAATVKYHDKAADHTTGTRTAVAIIYLAGALLALGYSMPLAESISLRHSGLLFFTLLMLLLMMLPVPARALATGRQGYISFDRLALVAAILIFGGAPAAWMAGTVVLVWTLFADPRREPFLQRIMRAAANAGMFVLSVLAAGYVYYRLGGHTPVVAFDLVTLGQALALVLTLQAVNELLFLFMAWPDLSANGHRWLFSWGSTATELLISITGIITALVYTNLPTFGFVLYVAFIVVIAILFKWMTGLAEARRSYADEFTAVNRINQLVSAATDLNKLLEHVFLEVKNLVPSAAFLLGVYKPRSNELDIHLNVDEGKRHPPCTRKLGQGILAWSIQNRASIFIANVQKDHHPALKKMITIGRESVSIIVVPIIYKDKPVGALSVQDYKPRAFTRHQLHLLEGFARQIAVAIVNIRLFDELKAQRQMLEVRVGKRTAELMKTTFSLTQVKEQTETLLAQLERESRSDALTGIANRRYLDEFLPIEMERAKRYSHPLTIAMLDIDNFKLVNDTLGHAMGDRVLCTIAKMLTTELRSTDRAIRYGGEEFIIVFPETTNSDGLAACEKLRTLIALYPWSRLARNLSVTMSFGVASLEYIEQTVPQILASADRALYQAKKTGRNRVCGSEPLQTLHAVGPRPHSLEVP
jgi:diguanylate cyclase (GGDEF)-like protein